MPANVSSVAATAFLQSIGVNAHLGFSNTAYTNERLVESSLDYLGVTHVRDNVPVAWTRANLETLADHGVKFDLYLPAVSGTVNVAANVAMLDALATAHPGMIASIEGPNEVLLRPIWFDSGSAAANEASLQHAIYSAVKADSILASVPIFNLTGGGTSSAAYQQFGDLSSSTDVANAHIYAPYGWAPSTVWSAGIDLAQVPTPGHVTAVTETGYNTLSSNITGVSESVQAKYTLDTLMDSAKSGVQQTFLYEL